jgi:LPXTG-motif cell wall-anchored protein
MTVKRLAAVLVCSAVALLVGAGGASAGLEGTPMLVLEPSTVAPGQSFTATLEGFCTNDAQINFTIDAGGMGPSLAFCQPDGRAIAHMTAPTRPDGYTVRAVAQQDIAQATLTVVASLGGSDGQPLPDTGPEHALLIAALGGALLCAGGALFGVARDRRT